MSTDPKNWRPGDIVTVGQSPATGEVELWDRAPVSMATRGFCDPWWARHDGRWVLGGAPSARAGTASATSARRTFTTACCPVWSR